MSEISEIKARYTGAVDVARDPAGHVLERLPREHYAGVPARDLSLAEYDALDDEQRAAVDSGRLYAVLASPDVTTETTQEAI